MKNVIASLQEIGNKLINTHSPEEVYALLIEEAKGLVRADYGSVFLWDGKRFNRVFTTIPVSQLVNPRLDGFAYAAFSAHEPCFLPREEILKINPQLAKTKVKMRVIIPLFHDDKTLGVITLRSTSRERLTHDELSVVKLFGTMASMYMYKMMLFHRVHKEMELRDAFVNLAAHELRTPLTSLNVYLSLLQKTRKRSSRISDRELLRRIIRASKRLTRIVNEFSDINKFESKQLRIHWRTVSISKLVVKVIEQFSSEIPDRHITFKNMLTTKRDFIKADSQKLIHVLYNLLNNANKFSPPLSRIRISLAFKDPYFLISIADEGIGINENDLQKIGKPFYKAQDNYKDGLGVGLFLSKKIIEQHRGFLSITSNKQKGTSVTIKLPKALL